MGAPLNVADILERAADLIEPEGAWAKGIYYHDPLRSCFCMVGAVSQVAGKSPGEIERGEIGDAIRDVLHGQYFLHQFNDAPDRTQAEVVAKLREAAAISRALPGGEGK